MSLEAINARARGLGTHLLSRNQIEALARAESIDALATMLQHDLGSERFDADGSVESVEAALLRWSGDLVEKLGRWLELQPAVASVLFAEEQRRALRRITRGIIAGQPPAWRLAGLLATPELPARALEELAHQTTLGGVAGQLMLLRNPFADAIAEEARRASTDAFRLDVALTRTLIDVLRRRARDAGDEAAAYVREIIDSENALAAIAIAEHPRDLQPAELFIPGGQQLDAATFAAAVAERSLEGALRILRTGCTGWLAGAFTDAQVQRSPDAAVLRARLAHHHQLARVAPLSLSPAIAFLLRLRLQLADLRRVLWQVAAAAPHGEPTIYSGVS